MDSGCLKKVFYESKNLDDTGRFMFKYIFIVYIE